MRAPLLAASLACVLALCPRAFATTEAVAPPGGGHGALAVRVDLPTATVHTRTCGELPCVADAASPSLALPLTKEQMPDAADVVVEAVRISSDRTVVHVHLPAKGDHVFGWDAVLAAGSAPIFEGKTGYVDGEEGERTGSLVQTLGDPPIRNVVVGTVREDLHLCGQDMTILNPAGLDPSTLALRGATVQRLPPAQREGASRVVASFHGGPPTPALAPLLVATGASSEIGSFKALTDGKLETTWAEARLGKGQGEFVEMSAPEEVPIARFSVVVAPPAAPPDPSVHAPSAPKGDPASAPQTFYLVTAKKTFAVTLPEDGRLHPGTAYDIPLPEPVRTSCVALVLGDEAYTHGRPHPEVGLAELYAYSPFDAEGAALEGVARALDGGGARGESAAGVLERAGAPGYTAMAAIYDKLDAAGRALAIHVASSASECEASAPLLIAAMADSDALVRRKATGKLQNPLCGRAAVPELVKALGDPKLRERAAPIAASLAPEQALEPLARAMGPGDAQERGALRRAFAQAASRSPADRVAALLSDRTRSPDGRLELLRAATGVLLDAAVRPAADAAIADVLAAPGGTMRLRYLLTEPMAALARAGDAQEAARLFDLLAHDTEPAVRAHAAELSTGIATADGPLALAAADADPRVREASLHAVSSLGLKRGRAPALQALANDPWTFVRTAAASALAALPPSPEVDEKLAHAIDYDASPRVRASVIAALAVRHATGKAKPIRERLGDVREDIDVRLASARALGLLCDAHSLERLTELARAGALPMIEEPAAELSAAATEALGWIHPLDLAKRLSPLLAKDARAQARESARSAIADHPHCP